MSAKIVFRRKGYILRHSPWSIFKRWFWRDMPRPRYCDMCGGRGWCTLEPAARSTAEGWLCEECADINALEWDAAWAEYYSGCL